MVIHGSVQSGETIEPLHFPSESQTVLCFLVFGAHAINKYLFCAPLKATILEFVCCLLVTSLFQTAPPSSVEVLSGVPKARRPCSALGRKNVR